MKSNRQGGKDISMQMPHANGFKMKLQDQSRCQRGFACTGTQQSPCGTSGEFGSVFVKGRRWELDVEAILAVSDNGVDCS